MNLTILRETARALRDIVFSKSYSQLGEDKVIENHLGWLGKDVNRPGFYLDIGAYHPTDGSNTYRFYRQSSSGVVIDVGEKKKKLFSLFRRHDYFIEAAVVPSHLYSPDGMDFDFAGEGYGSKSAGLLGVERPIVNDSMNIQKVATLKANEIYDRVKNLECFKQAKWRLLNIDIEGLDFDILIELDLDRFEFDIIAIEEFPPTERPEEKISYYLNESKIVKFLSQKYMLQSICGPTLIFCIKNQATI